MTAYCTHTATAVYATHAAVGQLLCYCDPVALFAEMLQQRLLPGLPT